MNTFVLHCLVRCAPRSAGHQGVKWAVGVMLLAATVNSAAAGPPSWVFSPGQFSHDPVTGARVAQYSRIPPVEPLDDPRAVTSVYRRSRTVLRGGDGSTDTYYQVQGFGNGRGGLDAEWERFHDAWKESYTAGGYYRGRYGPRPYDYGYPTDGRSTHTVATHTVATHHTGVIRQAMVAVTRCHPGRGKIGLA